ncbi:protein PAT1 homolog 1-like isoform X2 [Mytilus californianus]|uniref:protein PAT1 homolog 1-like isoform X2 n=1 Tax=Mytilus californianus TaxID=6549 RepID=UPI00224628D7|nr:protein PAT1 homolog 1-like isoform X2 [Mytilus californianus]
MEDTFSKLKSGVSAVGANPPEYDDCEENDDDIDFLNDETFGGEIEAGEFDWEEEHEKYAEVLEHDHTKHGQGMRDSGYGTTDKSYRSQEEYMEQSISQLVVDDEEDIEDPAILNVSKSYRIPKRETNLEELFGPESPPAFLDAEHLVSPSSRNIWGSPTKESHMQKPVNNLQSLFDFAKASSATVHRQHPSMSTPDQQRRSPQMIQKGHTLEELENQMLQRPPTITRPVTAEELERAMRGEVPPPPMHQAPRPNVPPQYRGVPQMPMQRPPQVYNQYPPSPMNVMNGRKSPLSGISISTPPTMIPQRMTEGHYSPITDMMGMTPPGRGAMIHPRMMEGRNSPLADVMGITPPRQNNMSPVMMGNSRQSPLGMMGLTPGRRTTPSPPTYSVSPLFMQSPLSQARLISPYARGQLLEMLANRAPTAPIGIPRQMGRGSIPPNHSPYNSPAPHQQSPYNNRNSYNSPANHHPSPTARFPIHPGQGHSPAGFSTPQPNRIPHHHNGNTDPRHTRGRGRGTYQNWGDKQNHPNYREREHRENYRDRDYRENRSFNNRRYYQYDADNEHRRMDDYAGLMTQKEKDWIIKIQLLQLQTDNPYIDDYYYTTFAIKKKALERQKQIENGELDGKNQPELVIPAMAKLETRAYKPAQFEGSLGRLTTSSVHNPRQIIDLQSHDIHDEGQGQSANKDLRKARQLLMEIEKGYNLLLEVDDIEKKILALPEEARTPLFEQRHDMLFSLYKYVISDDFLHLMMVRKGRKLVARCIPNLEKKNGEDVVMLILKRLQVLLKKDHLDEGLMVLHDPVVRTIQSCDLKSLVQFLSTLLSESDTASQALQNQFGSSVVCTLIHRGEVLYKDTSPLDIDNQLQTEWCQFVHDLASVLATVPLESLVKPKLPQTTISGHFDRLLNKKQIASLEDKLKVIAEPQTVS